MNVNNDPSLSLLSALRPSTPANRAVQTQQSTPSDLLVKPNRTGLPPAARATAPGGLTVDGLLEAWGGKSEMYDLNGDGGVNMLDLVQLLKNLRNQPAPPPADLGSTAPPPTSEPPPADVGSTAPPPATDPPPADVGSTAPQPEPTDLVSAGGGEDPAGSERATVQDLLAAWGTDDPEFDLNGDGTVNMRDLVQLLRDLGTPPPGGTDLISGDPMTIRGLLEQWGRSGSRYDLDGNGTVNMRDLVDMLGKLAEQREHRADGSQFGGLNERATFSGLKPIAASLVGQLRSDGFETHPPANIHALVNSLNLTGAQEKELINHLDAEYPAGLGVNVVG